MVEVAEYSVPAAGTDIVDITLEEAYEVEGVGTDTVTLRGTLVAERATPLLGPDADAVSWESATVVARFVALNVSGESKVFGPVNVALDASTPSFASVTGGACAAAVPVIVTMPQHGLTLRSAEPMQLRSRVTTVPPIGNEQTISVRPVELLDQRTNRTRGTLSRARVMWRELIAQVTH